MWPLWDNMQAGSAKIAYDAADELLGLPPKGAYALVKDAHDLLEHVSAIVERGMVGAGESHVRARLPPAKR